MYARNRSDSGRYTCTCIHSQNIYFLPHHLSTFSQPSSSLQFWSDFHFPVDILNRTKTQLTLAGRLTAGIEETDWRLLHTLCINRYMYAPLLPFDFQAQDKMLIWRIPTCRSSSFSCDTPPRYYRTGSRSRSTCAGGSGQHAACSTQINIRFLVRYN